MFYKEYTIPVHRKIATTVTSKSKVEDSHFFMETSNKEPEIYVNTFFESIIYNIERKEDSLVIYSNTLNLKVTDKFYKGKALYHSYIQSEESNLYLNLDEIEEKIVDEEYSDTYYLNSTEQMKLQANVNLIYNISNPLIRSDNVKVRKLKDRLKITIKGIKGLLATVDLNSKYIFEPVVHKNYIEFCESIVKVGSSVYYLYHNSFNKQTKTEIILRDSVSFKDPVLQLNDIYGRDKVVVEYETFKSNLLFNNKVESDFYYYLDLSSTDRTNLIHQSIVEEFSSDLLLIYSIKRRDVKRDIGINPHLRTELKTPRGENYTVVFQESYLDKYTRPEDIKIGTEVIKTNVIEISKSEVPYLNIDGQQYYQDLSVNLWPYSEYNEHSTEDLDSIFYDNYRELVHHLKNWYNDGVEYT